MEELDGMAALTDGVINQRWPHTVDACDEYGRWLDEQVKKEGA